MGAEKEHLPSNPRQLGPTSGLRAVKFKLLLALNLASMVSNLTSLVYWFMFAWTSNVLASVPVRARAAFGVVRCSPGGSLDSSELSASNRRCGAASLGERPT